MMNFLFSSEIKYKTLHVFIPVADPGFELMWDVDNVDG